MLVCLALLCCAAPAQTAPTRHVPLPQPRPSQAPAPSPPAEAEKPSDADTPAAAQRPPEPPPPSACRLALTEAIAVAPSIAAIHGPGACGGDDLVRLEAVVLPDHSRVPFKPAATLRCTMAATVADWVRTDMVALATELGTRLGELDNFDSFDCRGRNRVAGAKMSEHGRANALDIRALKLVSGQSIALTDRSTPRGLREKVLGSVCARFTTVLGPGSDGYHEDHIHLDLAERRGNYRICQWAVWDPLPPVAPLMPAQRPAEAPPRAIADGETKSDAGRSDAATSDGKAGPNAAAPAEPDHPVKPKPRRRRAAARPFNLLR